MLKTVNEQYRETYYEETLDNGLHVVLWHKPDYVKSFFLMATPMGAYDIEQIDENGNEIVYPAGIAHFLEHKMFEDEEDVMETFSKMGANVNAFTSYSETAYYFSTTQDVIEPLHLLLDFVQELKINKESVEKEKGIIIQELNMYQQLPDTRLLMEIFKSLYHVHPLKYDIGGDSESVTSTTLEKLYECYERNYHPEKMILVGVSSYDPEVLMKEIKENQAKKQFKTYQKIERKNIEEPDETVRKDFTFHMDITVPKVSLAYKFHGIKDVLQRVKHEWCLKFMMDYHFSALNPDYQKWIDDKIINDYFGFEIDYGNDFGFMMMYSETWKEDEFLVLMKKELEKVKELKMNNEILIQLKRRYYSQLVRSLNSFYEIGTSTMRNYFSHTDFFETMDIVQSITAVDIEEAMQSLDLSNYSIVRLHPTQEVQ